MKYSVRFISISAVLALVFVALWGSAAHAADGTWTNPVNGLDWSTGGNWSSSIVADGSSSTAYFNTLNIVGETTVHLDTPHTIGNITFGDTDSGSPAGWYMDDDGESTNTLTLAGGTPRITVNASGTGSTTISAVIAGTAGIDVEGGGALNVISSGNTVGGTSYIGNNSANNTLNVKNGGMLVTNGGILYIGGATTGGNKLDISTPGNGTSPSLRIYTLYMGSSSAGNNITVGNGASWTISGAGNSAWWMGQNAGGNSNSIIITGTGSTIDRGLAQGSAIQVGGVGDGNFIRVDQGGTLAPKRIVVSDTGGDNNYVLITGRNSRYDGQNYNQTIFRIGAADGATNNSFRVENGGSANVGASNNQNSRPFSIGYGTGSDRNYVLVTGTGSTLTLINTQPVSIGGNITSGSTVDSSASNNRLDVFDGGALTINASLYVMGVNSALNLGNGTGIGIATIGSTAGFIQCTVLTNSTSRLNFNNGQLNASVNGILVSGPGMISNTGPAYVYTALSNEISSIITGPGSFTKLGRGVLNLTAANNFTGGAFVNEGYLLASVSNAVGAGAVINGGTLVANGVNVLDGAWVTNNTGSLLFTSTNSAGSGVITMASNSSSVGTTYALDQDFVVWATNRLGMVPAVFALGSDSGATLDFSSDPSLANTYIGGAGLGDVSYSGAMPWADNTLRLGGGARTLLYSSAIGSGANLLVGPVNGCTGSVVVLTDSMADGWVTINSGTLQIGANGASGSLGTGSVTNNGTLAFTRNDYFVNNNYTMDSSSTGRLAQYGSGTLVLNSYLGHTGGTVITNGILLLSGGNDRLAAVSPVTITGGTLDLGGNSQSNSSSVLFLGGVVQNGTLIKYGTAYDGQAGMVSATLAGDAGLVKSGSGRLTLSGPNTLTGGVTINAGTLAIAGDGNLGASSAGLTLNGGVLDTGAGICTVGSRSVTLLSGGGVITNTGSLDVTGVISGVGGLTKAGSGTLTLSAANMFGGGMAVNGGILAIASDVNLGAAGSGLTFNGGTLDTGTNNVALGGRAVTLMSGGGVITSTGSLALTNTVTGTGGLTKNGIGTLTLSSTNTYGGNTTVNGGRLMIADAGVINDYAGVVGNTVADSNAAVIVTGVGSVWNNTSLLTVGNSGSGNSLSVANGGSIRSRAGTIGNAASAGYNRVDVTGVNASWDLNQGALKVGNGGGISNVLNISDGGVVTNVGRLTVNAGNTVNVFGGSLTARSLRLRTGSAIGMEYGVPRSVNILGDATLDGFVVVKPVNLPSSGWITGTVLTCSGTLSGSGLTVGPLPSGFIGTVYTNTLPDGSKQVNLSILGPHGTVMVVR